MKKSKLVKNSFRARPALIAGAGVIVLVAAALSNTFVLADQFDEQIRALQQDNNAKRQIVSDLQSQANSYQDAINKLESQIASLQQNIQVHQQRVVDLQKEIEANEAELEKQKYVLGQNIKAMYMEGEISVLEALASSKDLSEYVDKQEYRNSVQDKVRSTMDKIARIKQELQTQKVEVEAQLKAEEEERNELAAAQSQQAQLLAYTEGQKAAYNSQIKDNQNKIADLRRQQIIQNSRYNIGSLSGDPNHGGYPTVWHNAPQDSLIDYWGMFNRECVSYTAFKVHQDYLLGKNNRDMPYWGGIGNANQWDDNARASGIPVDFNPTPGSIAISNAGTWGHAMYVEAVSTVNGQPAIYISQYNAGLDGQYSEGWRYTTGLVFLHF